MYVHWLIQSPCGQWRREENTGIIYLVVGIMLSPFCLVQHTGVFSFLFGHWILAVPLEDAYLGTASGILLQPWIWRMQPECGGKNWWRGTNKWVGSKRSFYLLCRNHAGRPWGGKPGMGTDSREMTDVIIKSESCASLAIHLLPNDIFFIPCWFLLPFVRNLSAEWNRVWFEWRL